MLAAIVSFLKKLSCNTIPICSLQLLIFKLFIVIPEIKISLYLAQLSIKRSSKVLLPDPESPIIPIES